jgi:hypothetical protein
MMRAFVYVCVALVSLAAASPFAALAQHDGVPEPEGMVLLTIGGLVGKTNREAFDKNRDSALGELKASFSRAYAFDREMLLALPQGTVTAVTTELGDEAVFKGPYLQDVLVTVEAAKVKTRFVASDGYSGYLLPEDIDGSDYILALEANGKPLGLNGQGPIWLMNTRKEGETVGSDNRRSHVWSVVYMHLGD